MNFQKYFFLEISNNSQLLKVPVAVKRLKSAAQERELIILASNF